jgi:hypothetical protein
VVEEGWRPRGLWGLLAGVAGGRGLLLKRHILK